MVCYVMFMICSLKCEEFKKWIELNNAATFVFILVVPEV